MKFDQLVIRKIIKIIATRYHILGLKCTISIPGVRTFLSLSVYPRTVGKLCVCPLDGVWHNSY